MLTAVEAASRGYTFSPDGETCVVKKDGEHVATIVSSCPKFFALRAVADMEGDELADTPVTPDLVAQVSGEALVEDAVALDVVDPTAGDLILGAIGKLDPTTATASDVIGAITSALDASGATAADPAAQTAAGPSGASASL